MVKKLLIIIGFVIMMAAIVSSVFLYKRYDESLENLNKLEVENKSLIKDKAELTDREEEYQDTVLSLGEKLDVSEATVLQLSEDIEEQMAEKNKTENELEDAQLLIKEIGEKLKTTSDPLMKIQQLMNENETLREYLNKESEKITDEAVDEDEVEEIETVDYSSLIDQLKIELADVSALVESRIGELEQVSQPLSEFSLERILIQTEIDFLLDIQEDVNDIRHKSGS